MSLFLPRISSIRLILIPFSCHLALCISQPVYAEKVATERWNISADKVVRYENPNSIVAQGSVILEKNEKIRVKPQHQVKTTSWSELLEETASKPPETKAADVEKDDAPKYHTTVTIMADWMVYDVELESIKAKGNVQIKTNEDQVFAKEATLNLTNETGKFTDATVLREEKSLHLEGKNIEKTGLDTYRIDDGWVITCKIDDGETPPWSFSSANVDVRFGGYAVLTNAKFNIKNVPVLYTPYMILPAKNTRQSGFLFPYFSTSAISGFGMNVPFFLNISDSADVTFFPEFYSKRGFMPGAEFRYASDVTDKGMFTASFLDDALSDPSETDYYRDTRYTHDNNERYWIRGKANHVFAGGWQARLDVDVVSDQDYLTEFNSGVTGFQKTYERYLETYGRAFQNQTDYFRQNTLRLLRSYKGMSLQANFLAIDDVRTNASETNTPLWQLPSIGFSGALPVGDTSFSVDWNTDYVDYWRKDGIGGHRFDIHPSVSTTIPLSSYLESRAEIALRDTFYVVRTYGDAEWGNDDTQNRFLPEYSAEVATTLQRDFFTGQNESEGFSHQIRPYIKYGYIPDVDQKKLPRFDDVDLVVAKNAITYGVDNFFNIFDEKDRDRLGVWDTGSLKVAQSYSLLDASSDEPLSPIHAELGLAPYDNLRFSYKTDYNTYDQLFILHSFGGEFRNSRGDHFIIDYSFRDKEHLNDYNNWARTTVLEEVPAQDIQQINARILAPIVNRWYLGGEIQHSLSQDETIKANGSITYRALCWSVKFETQYTPADTSYIVLFNLANIGIPFGVDL